MADQPTSPTPTPADSAEQRLDLALRLLTMQYRVASDQLRLTPGKLPDDLPFALPLPEGARVLGALSIAQPDQPDHHPLLAIILVETPHTLEQGAQRLSATLEAQGWAQNAIPHMRGGFVHVMPGHHFMRFRAPSGDDVLSISPLPEASAPTTTFSISVQREPPFSDQRRPDAFRDLNELIPPLLPPPGATQEGGGGGGGNRRRYASANLTTDAPIAEVMANYDRQMEGGGWRRRSGGASASAGWSFWSFTDQEGAEWRGALVAFSDPERPRDYLAMVQIETDSRDDGGGSSWTVHSGISSQAIIRG